MKNVAVRGYFVVGMWGDGGPPANLKDAGRFSGFQNPVNPRRLQVRGAWG